jgi:hypothetical protein
MHQVPINSRQEIKFVSNFYSLPKTLAWIKLNKLGFSKEYPDRWVNNVYFDTYDYEAYSSNLSGESSRRKIRYRWYGEKTLDCGQVEIKNKRNYFGWKNTYHLTKNPYQKGDTWKRVIENITSDLPKNSKHLLKLNNFPVIINRYYRSYFISMDEKIRVTIDTNQSVYDQRYKPLPNFSNKSNQIDTFVLEVKFDRSEGFIASDFITGLPIRVSRHSKYINAVNSITGRGYY